MHFLCSMHSSSRIWLLRLATGAQGGEGGWRTGENEWSWHKRGTQEARYWEAVSTSFQYSCCRVSVRSLVGVSAFSKKMKKLGSCDICEGTVLSERGVVCGYCGEVVHFRYAGKVLFIIYKILLIIHSKGDIIHRGPNYCDTYV